MMPFECLTFNGAVNIERVP